jgi:hypothetical protein
MSFRSTTQLTRRALLAGAGASALAVRGTSAQEGTPERPQPVPPQPSPAAGTGTNANFVEMLALAPDVMAQPEPPMQIAQFGDVAAQLAALGREQPTSGIDPAFEGWIAATQAVPMPRPLAQYAMVPEFEEFLGFTFFQIDQGLQVGEPPELMTFLRGRFDEDAMRAAWMNAGYQTLDEGGVEVFSLAEGPEFDPDNPLQRMFLANVNNATILPDGTVAFAPTLELMRGILAVVAGEAPSLADNDQVAALLSTVDLPLAGAMIFDGESLAAGAVFDPRMTPEQIEQVQQDLDESGEMPPVQLALFGVTPGGPIPPPPDEPDATPEAMDVPAIYVIRLLMASAASAETAAETIPNRIATLNSLVRNQPYSEMFTVRRSEALDNPPAVVLDLDFVVGEMIPAAWYQVISQRDLLFLAS